MIQNCFASTPPDSSNHGIGLLRERVLEIVYEVASPESISKGKSAALAMNAVASLAILGDIRFRDILAAAASGKTRWFAEMTADFILEHTRLWSDFNIAKVGILYAIKEIGLHKSYSE